MMKLPVQCEFYTHTVPMFLLFQKQMKQLPGNPPVGLITYRQIHPGFFIYNALIMGKGFKSFFTMIASHTAFSEPSKGQFTGCKMNDYIIDTAASESAFRGDFVYYSLILCKNIKCKRMSQGIYFMDNLIKARKFLPALWHPRR